MRLRYGDDFAGTTQAVRYGETLRPRRHHRHLAPGWPCARLGADRSRCRTGSPSWRPATTRTWPIRPVRRSNWCDAMCSSPRQRSGYRSFDTAMPAREIDKLLRSVALFPERAHLVGAYSLGKAQRVIALIRAAGYDKPIYLHGALDAITRLLRKRDRSRGVAQRARHAQDGSCRRDRALSAFRSQRCVDAALPRSARRHSRRAGCACAHARANTGSNCRW